MPRKVYSTNESGFTEIFFLSNGYTLKDTICSFTDFATELLFSCKLQNSQQRKNIAFENIFKFNSTCPVANWVIHLWIGKLLNDNWINVNSVKSSRFPLIYRFISPRDLASEYIQCKRRRWGWWVANDRPGVASSIRFCQRGRLVDP